MGMTTRVRYRWILPIGHLAVDLLLLAAWINYGAMLLRNIKSHGVAHPASAPIVRVQDSDVEVWDPPPYLPPQCAFLLSGTAPAGEVSLAARPEAWNITRYKLWDPIWLLIHEAIACPLWFLIGMRIDTGRSRLRKTMVLYLIGRAGFGLLVVGVPDAAGLGVLLQVLFWLGLAVYGLKCATEWIGRVVRSMRKNPSAA
jgi:hypothetical protein